MYILPLKFILQMLSVGEILVENKYVPVCVLKTIKSASRDSYFEE